jgi:hypothetical protein
MSRDDDATTQPDSVMTELDDEDAAPAPPPPPVPDADGVIRPRVLPPLAGGALLGSPVPASAAAAAPFGVAYYWTATEDAVLRAALRRYSLEYGPPPSSGDPFPQHPSFPFWRRVAAELPGRSPRSCYTRFTKYPSPPTDASYNKLWAQAEVVALQRAAARHAAKLERVPSCSETWGTICSELVAEGFPRRSLKAVAAKWRGL